MIYVPTWLICVYIVFVIFTAILGFGTGYKLSDDAWMEFYMDLTKKENEEDLL